VAAKVKYGRRACFFDEVATDDGRVMRALKSTKPEGAVLLVVPAAWDFTTQPQPTNCYEATKGMAFVLEDAGVESPFPSATATPQPPPSRRSSNAQPPQSLATKPAAATPHRPTRVPTAPRRIPISEIHSDGPVDVRAYTVDPVSKRQQLKAISDMIDAEVAARAEAELVKLSSIPGFARSTASTVHRVERGPFDWAPAADPLKLDDAPSPVASTMAANRSATRSARGRGAPPILAISTAASSVTATLRTPFRLSAPQPSPRVLL
jgi:hypothetical protein